MVTPVSIGDALDAFMALMVFKTCCQVEGGLPNALKMQMMFNVVLDFAIGLVPFLGDLADAAFKANSRNALLLEQHLRDKGKKELRKSGQPIPAIDPSSPEEFDRMRQESPPGYQTNPPSRHGTTAAAPRPSRDDRTPRAPEEARVRGGGGGWFGRGRSRLDDVERGPNEDRRGAVEETRQQRKGPR